MSSLGSMAILAKLAALVKGTKPFLSRMYVCQMQSPSSHLVDIDPTQMISTEQWSTMILLTTMLAEKV